MRLESRGQVVDLNRDIIIVTYERDVMVVSVVESTSHLVYLRFRITQVIVKHQIAVHLHTATTSFN